MGKNMEKKVLQSVCSIISLLWGYIESKMIKDIQLTIKINENITPYPPHCDWVFTLPEIESEFFNQVMLPEIARYIYQTQSYMAVHIAAPDGSWKCCSPLKTPYCPPSDLNLFPAPNEIATPSAESVSYLTLHVPFEFMQQLIADAAIQQLLDMLPKQITREIFRISMERRLLFIK